MASGLPSDSTGPVKPCYRVCMRVQQAQIKYTRLQTRPGRQRKTFPSCAQAPVPYARPGRGEGAHETRQIGLVLVGHQREQLPVGALLPRMPSLAKTRWSSLAAKALHDLQGVQLHFTVTSSNPCNVAGLARGTMRHESASVAHCTTVKQQTLQQHDQQQGCRGQNNIVLCMFSTGQKVIWTSTWIARQCRRLESARYATDQIRCYRRPSQ